MECGREGIKWDGKSEDLEKILQVMELEVKNRLEGYHRETTA